MSQVHLSHCHQQSVSPLREHLNVTISVAAWRRVTQCDATWRDDHSISRVSLPSSAPLSPLASIDQQPTQTLSTQGSPAYTALSPQLILELIFPVVTSVNISSHWVGMYACTSQCHPADLHHGDQVRYCQQCGDKINVWICLFRSNQVVETVCYCNTDLCNGAGLAENSVFMMIIFTLYTLNIIMQWIIAWLIVHSRHGYSAFKLGWVRIPTFNVFHTQMFNWLHFLVIKYN